MDSNDRGRRELSAPKQRGGSSLGRDWYFGDGYEPREMLGLEPEVLEFPFVTMYLGCAGVVSGLSAVIAAARVLSHDPPVLPAAWQAVGFAVASTVIGRLALWRILRRRVNGRRYILADAVLVPMTAGTAIAAWAGSTTVAAVGSLVTLGSLVLSGIALPHVPWFRARTRSVFRSESSGGRGWSRWSPF